MTNSPPHDPLVALWQTSPKPDTRHLVQDIQRLNRLHQRLNRSVLAILCGIAILLIFEEATGRLGSHGILSVVWVGGLGIGLIQRRRARCNRPIALTLDTVSLLKSMIARAKNDLFIARCLYAGVPLGAVIGSLVMRLATNGAPPVARAVSPHLQLIQIGAGIAALVIMMLAGVILAHSRHHQVEELSKKLRDIEADL